MGSSKDDILDGQCLKDVGEVFVLPVTRCRLSTSQGFFQLWFCIVVTASSRERAWYV